MPVGNIERADFPTIAGVKLAAVAAGIRYKDRNDLVLIELLAGSAMAACFTQSAFKAAPVIVAQAHMQAPQSGAQYLLINSGNANAATGVQGKNDAASSCAAVAKVMSVATTNVLPFSTGVIGEPLNMSAMFAGIEQAVTELSEDNWHAAAQAILTTDLVTKTASKTLLIGGKKVNINGFAKGSGMIRPDMATMLAYVFTDASINQATLQQICSAATADSFNRITVDGDTSTNDAVVLSATQQVSNPCIESLNNEDGQQLLTAVTELCQQLAQMMVRDGEGATKFVTVKVAGAKHSKDALAVAYSIAQSPLVKTALYASDPNWGRFVMAVGKAGVAGLDQESVSIWADSVMIVDQGVVATDYTEEKGQAVFEQAEYTLHVDLGMGETSETVWTCDFSYDYVRINSNYRS